MEKSHSSLTKKLKFPFIFFCAFGLGLMLAGQAFSQNTKLNINDKEYFETRGANIFVFSNQYNGMFFDEKTAGIEIIHHGVRTSTGGAVRLQNTPEQWDLVPAVVDRKVDAKNNSIDVVLRYESLDFESKVNVTADGNGVLISVHLDEPLPDKPVLTLSFYRPPILKKHT